MTTSKTSRRALLAGMAVAPIAGLPAIAHATIADPVLEAIAEYEREDAACQAATDAEQAAGDAYRAACEAAGKVIYKGETIYSMERLEALARNSPFLHPGLSDAELEETIAKIRCGVAAQKAERESLEAMKERREYQAARVALEARLPAYEKARADHGVNAADEAIQDALDAEGDALEAVFEALPTTKNGAIAVLRFIAEFLDGLGVNDTRADSLPDAIRNAADFLDGQAA